MFLRSVPNFFQKKKCFKEIDGVSIVEERGGGGRGEGCRES